MKLNWQNVAVGVLGLLLSLFVWLANASLGRVEALEAEMVDRRVESGAQAEAILGFRADQKETLERVKRIEQHLLQGR